MFNLDLDSYNSHRRSKRPTRKPITFDFYSNLESPKLLNPKSRFINLITSLIIVSMVFLLFIYKAYSLQILKSQYMKSLALGNKIRSVSIQPERGVIYDRLRHILVRNKPALSVEMNTDMCSLGGRELNLCEAVVNRLGDYAQIDKTRVLKDINEGKKFIVIATGLDKEAVIKLETQIKQFPSLTITTVPQRDYLYDEAFAHLIGYTGLGEGRTGVEEKYDTYLGGIAGSRVIEVSSTGEYLRSLSEINPTAGNYATLYVDLALQQKAYELLKAVVDAKKATAGVVVAQDPKTGGILAAVSYPSFSPNLMAGNISSQELAAINSDPGFPFFNRAIGGVYPPGSVFKLVVAAAGLSEKVMDAYTTIFDKGYIQIGAYRFNNWKLEGHGIVDLAKALQVSNDTYFYTVGGGLGIDKLSSWAKKFGYGSKTNIDLNGEAVGFIPDSTYKHWYLGDTYITAIGQGDVLATPLQVNNVTVYFANGGSLFKPQVVKSINNVRNFPPQIIAYGLVDTKTYDAVRKGMALAVLPGGTAYPVFDFQDKHKGIVLAGKTGTSEYFDSNGEPKTHAWFTVFGPYDNASVALTVFLEGGGSGSDDAAPIARQLLDLWFK